MTETDIEQACDDLKDALVTLLENGYNDEDYDNANKRLLDLGKIVDGID